MTRVTYIDAIDNTLIGSDDTLLYAYDDSTFATRIVYGVDMAETACAVLLASSDLDAAEHPLNSYNIVYPYARTAVKIRMDDTRPEEQVAQLSIVAPYLVIRLILCDYAGTKAIPSIVTVTDGPEQIYPCVLETYYNYRAQEIYVLIESAKIGTPARIRFNITDTMGRNRACWIGIRAHRAGVPSGAVV
jgi:hypothetical protein